MLNAGLITGLLIIVLAFIGGCYPSEAGEGGGTSILPLIIFLIFMI